MASPSCAAVFLALLCVPYIACSGGSQLQGELSLPELIERDGTADVIVIFREAPPTSDREALFAFNDPATYLSSDFASLSQASRSSVASLGRTAAASLRVDEAGLRKLRENEHVAMVAPNRAHWPLLESTAALSGLGQLRDSLLESGAESGLGRGYSIAILDTGFDANHPFLRGKVVDGACFSRNDPERGIESLCPGGVEQENGEVTEYGASAAKACPANVSGCGHGTHVAGIAAGGTTKDPRDESRDLEGVAPKASILAIQVFSKFTRATDCAPRPAPCVRALDSSILRALDYLLITVLRHSLGEQAPRIVAVSLSMGSGTNVVHCDQSNPLTRSINQLSLSGIPTFAASGNAGFLLGVASPACISSVVSIGAINKKGKIWSKTNRGRGNLVDLMAIGVGVYSSVPGGAFKSEDGTSMAAPAAAGAFASLKSLHPERTGKDILAALIHSGHKVVDPASRWPFPLVHAAKAHDLLKTGLPIAAAAEGTTPSMPGVEGEPAREFILAVDPAYDPTSVFEMISEESGEIADETDAGGIEVFRLTRDSLQIRAVSPIDSSRLSASLDDRTDAIGGVFPAAETGHGPL